ncbi:MAG: 16S rRNA (cytosine(967)-C(5))-methyltransferase RsmB [Pyrinomonadaceae bacterium]
MDKRKFAAEKPYSKPHNRKVSPARLSAFEILLKIEKESAFSSVLLPLYEEKLEVKDRALCHELTLGVLRNQIYLDWAAQKFSKSKIEKFDSEVLTALRLGIYQMLFLDKVPVFAAINESVNLVYLSKKSSAGGMVNAVLRKIEREKPLQIEAKDEIEKLSIETSHPSWLVEHWAENFGLEETKKLAAANNVAPGTVFRLTGKSDEKTVETLRKFGLELVNSKIVSNAWRISKPNEMFRVFADEGRIYFQDESSQLVGQIINLKKSESFLDVCAAPGSKTTYISAFQASDRESVDNKSNIFAGGDKHFHRLRVLRENCRRVGAENVSIAAYDAEYALPFKEETFDCVLVDAPCSGTGTIRHNPEIKYFLKPEDLIELPLKQLVILENASKVLKIGGRLIYSTCSLECSENEGVIEKFISGNADFKISSNGIPDRFLTSEGFARTFPQRDDTDGFFIAMLEKS